MDDDSVSKPSAFFKIKDLYQQAEELGLRTKIPAQRKIVLNEQGLGLRLSTGTQLEDERPKKRKSCCPKSKTKVYKQTFGTLLQHMQEIKGSLTTNTARLEVLDEGEVATKENEEPTTNKNENDILTPPFVVDLLTQEENSLAPLHGDFWATGRPDQWTRVFQAHSTEGGMDFYVDQEALREVAGSLLRDLNSANTEKSAADTCGREY